MITLTANEINQITAHITDLVGGTWQLIALIVGIPLAFWVIKSIIRFINKPMSYHGRYYE